MDGKIFRINRFVLIILIASQFSTSVLSAPRKIIPEGIPKIKVLVGKSIDKVSITGTDLRRYLYPTKELRRYAGRKRVKFNCQNLFSQNSKQAIPLLLASLHSPTGLVTFKDDKYQGRLLVLTSPGRKSCDVVNEIDLESYISPLLSKEMNGSWPIEALKAQAVAARTYAVNKMNSRKNSVRTGINLYDIESSEKNQVSGSFFDSTKNTFVSTSQTRGEILVTKKNDEIVPVFFHAESGGRTLLPQEVWNNFVDGYESVKMPYAVPKWKWTKSFSEEDFRKFLKWSLEKYPTGKSNFQVVDDKNVPMLLAPDRLDNIHLRVYIGSNIYVINKVLFRQHFGRDYIGSNNFVVKKDVSRYVLDGFGKGHSVGMSQIGAKRLAESGWKYTDILKYYYPGLKIVKIY